MAMNLICARADRATFIKIIIGPHNYKRAFILTGEVFMPLR